MKFVHIDGDVVRYRAGFAAETGFWRPVCYDEEDNIIRTGEREAYKSVVDLDEWDDVIYDPEPEPLANCLHSVKLVFQEVLDTLGLGIQRCMVHLSSPVETFRHKLATIRPYKGTRDPSHKPFWFDQITEYIEDNWPVRWSTEGYEADDEMAIRHLAFGKGSCIATIDKDLDMIPGWHYNFVNKEKYYVNEDEALRHFWTQVLTGDSADNIQGCPGIGEVRAKKALEGVEKVELRLRVQDCYTKAYKGDEEKALQSLVENARLLWILREPGSRAPLPGEWYEKYVHS